MDSQAPARLAITATVLYLLNLLLLPGLAFVVLVAIRHRHRDGCDAVARSHLDSAFRGSLLAGVLLVCITAAIFLLGGAGNPATWVALVLYFTTIHAALVLVGVIALTRAMAGQPFRFPLVGPRT